MLGNLPSAWLAGIKIEMLTEHQAVISVRYKWFNKNPFRSLYFGIMAIAAEVSTGVLCMGHLYKRQPSVSMLLVKTEAVFHKKATGKILFTCSDGDVVKDAILAAVATNKPTEVKCYSAAVNQDGVLVAELYYEWSFKARM